jgi:hypothetical protein
MHGVAMCGKLRATDQLNLRLPVASVWPSGFFLFCTWRIVAMPRDGADQSPDPRESPAGMLARAARIRQHARFYIDDPAANLMEQFADELEARARQVELSEGVLEHRRIRRAGHLKLPTQS